MYCTNCGAQNADSRSSCTNCGASLPASSCYAQQGSYAQQGNYAQQRSVDAALPGLGMKWHKFLIYFSLWAAAVLNAFTGVQTMLGLHYGGQAELVYDIFSGLKGVDIVYGLACLAMAALAVYTRFQLAGYKRNGPSWLLICNAVSIGLPVAYLLAVQAVLGESIPLGSSDYSSMVSSAVMLVINYVYYKKRKALFVN